MTYVQTGFWFMPAAAICTSCHCPYFCAQLVVSWKPFSKKVSKFHIVVFLAALCCFFPSNPQLCCVIWSYALVHPLQYVLCSACLWLGYKACHTKDAWVSFCHCISTYVTNEHSFNADRPADFQNLRSGGPLLPFHIKHGSDSNNK